jgi:hypothetical protein
MLFLVNLLLRLRYIGNPRDVTHQYGSVICSCQESFDSKRIPRSAALTMTCPIGSNAVAAGQGTFRTCSIYPTVETGNHPAACHAALVPGREPPPGTKSSFAHLREQPLQIKAVSRAEALQRTGLELPHKARGPQQPAPCSRWTTWPPLCEWVPAQ